MKNKFVTFSYDDGVTQDIRLVEMFDKYGLKCTFNINSELLGKDGYLEYGGARINHTKIKSEDVRKVYKNHEIAAHTLTHPLLRDCSEEEILRQVEEDRLNLSEIVGYEIIGMAYPGGTGAIGNRAPDIIREKTGIKYARTTTSAYNFEPQSNLIMFNPSVYHLEWDKLFSLGEEFVNLKTDKKQIFFVWGHAYEFDFHDTWNKMEEFCKLISGKDDIFYGTNREVLL